MVNRRTLSEVRTSEVTSSLSEGLGFRLNRLARVIKQRWTDDVEDLGLTAPQAAVLRGIAQSPRGGSVRSLARLLASDAMSVKRCADGLEARGAICSGSLAADRRLRTLTLTDEGVALVRALEHRVRAQEELFNAQLGPGPRTQLEAAITTLEKGFGVTSSASSTGDRRTRTTGNEINDQQEKDEER